MEMKNLKVLFYGGGAVGALYAWAIKRGVPNSFVNVVCRSNYEVVKREGYKINSYIATEIFKPDNVFNNREEIVEELKSSSMPYDYVILSTKVTSGSKNSTDLLKGICNDETTSIVLMQNGIGIEQRYAELFDKCPIISCILMLTCSLQNQNIVNHKAFTRMYIGPYYLTKEKKEEAEACTSKGLLYSIKKFEDTLKTCKINVNSIINPVEFQAIRWSKLSLNIAAGGTQVLTGGCCAGDLWSDNLSEHTIAVYNEIFDTGTKIFNVPLPIAPYPGYDIVRKFNLESPDTTTSFTKDWFSGYELELIPLFANALAVAKKFNIQMPRTHTMYSLIRSYKYNVPVKPPMPYNYDVENENIVLFPTD